MQNRILNLKRDKKDDRDLLFKNEVRLFSAPIKPWVNLKRKMSKVEDQGSLGSCTANAFAGNVEFLANINGDLFEASRLFIYWNERAYINAINEDSGAYLRDGIKSLKAHGVCCEHVWPYEISRFTIKPSQDSYDQAAKRKISKYMRIQTIEEMKQCLSDGFPFVFGLTLYESFMSSRVERTGNVSMPNKIDYEAGGHAMLCVGYSEKTQRFLVRNSWGESWGKKGYCTIPYEYMKQADDVWTIRA
jgi:C1A family cysteine protease